MMKTNATEELEYFLKDPLKEKHHIHKLWFQFQDYLKKWYFYLDTRWNRNLEQTKRIYKHFDIKKVIGWNAMTRMSRFIKKHPDVIEIRIDDSCHAGSSLYLIPHETPDEYWGTSVLFIPQCTDEQNNFFLYPEHLDRLIKALKEIQKRQKEKPGRWGD